MYARLEKAKGPQSRCRSDLVGQQKNNVRRGICVADNRPSSHAQMTLQRVANGAFSKNNRLVPFAQSIQRKEVERRTGKPGYWPAKKIQSNNMGTKWWQFAPGPKKYIQDDFVNNELDTDTYTGGKIPSKDYGKNAVTVKTDVESAKYPGYMEMAKGRYKKLSEVSDKAVYDAASRISSVSYEGTGNTWHHGKITGEMFLLDTEIHQAFAPHKGWASKGGSRNEMKDFIENDDSEDSGNEDYEPDLMDISDEY